MVTVTDNAAEKIRELMASEPEGESGRPPDRRSGRRVLGLPVRARLRPGPQDGDNEIEANGVRVVIDPFSAPYLAGSEIDFVDALMGAGFAINNPNVQAACGCGSSFQAKEGVADEPVTAPRAGAPRRGLRRSCGCH